MSIRKILLDYRLSNKHKSLPPTVFYPTIDVIVQIFNTWSIFVKSLRKFSTSKFKSIMNNNNHLSNKILNNIVNDYEYVHVLELSFKTNFHIVSKKNELNLNSPVYNTIIRGPFHNLGDPVIDIIEDLFILKRKLIGIAYGKKLWTKEDGSTDSLRYQANCAGVLNAMNMDMNASKFCSSMAKLTS
jgi:hypothetical protein